jgi:hypothetical protein
MGWRKDSVENFATILSAGFAGVAIPAVLGGFLLAVTWLMN